MFRDRTERTLFRAGTVPETVPVRSLLVTLLMGMGRAAVEVTPDKIKKLAAFIVMMST